MHNKKVQKDEIGPLYPQPNSILFYPDWMIDLSLDDIISANRETSLKGRFGSQARRGWGDAIRGNSPPLAGAAELSEMDRFGIDRSWQPSRGSKGNFKGRGSRGKNRYEPYAASGWGFTEETGRWDHPSSGSRRVIIGNLDYEVMATDLEELFADFDVQKVWIDYDSTDRSIGTGGAIFGSHASAIRACREFNGCALDGREVFLELERGSPWGKGKGKGGFW